MSNKVIYVPLDDRPPNLQFVNTLSKLGNVDLITPPTEYIGKFFESGDTDSIKSWLFNQKAEVLIIALDMLIYGGLIASRDFTKTTLDNALKNLKFLKKYKEKYPNTKIYAFSTVMRLSISVRDEVSARWWEQLNKYNELIYKIEVLKDVSYTKELDRLLLNIPSKILNEYTFARKRNHKVNLLELSLVKEGVIDYLIFSQEDCSPYGLHVKEHEIIKSQIKEFNLEDKVYLFDGADEVGQILLSKYINCINNYKPKIYIEYDSSEGANNVAKYEGIPVCKNVEYHIKSAGALIVNNPKEADFILAVATPHNPQFDSGVKNEEIYNKRKIVEDFTGKIDEYILNGFRVFLTDLTCANGADVNLMKCLGKRKLFLKLIGYSGWNTAGNSIGTSVAHGCIVSVASKFGLLNKEKSSFSLKFLIERILDDYLYQSVIRKLTDNYCRDVGVNVYGMAGRNPSIENFISCNLDKMISNSYGNKTVDYLSNIYDVSSINYSFVLPWNRLFEIEIDVCLK